MSVAIGLLATALLYACVGVLSVVVATLLISRLPDLPDSPPSHAFPMWLMPSMFAVFGVLLVLVHASLVQVGTIALLAIPLGAIILVDARKGLIPDALTLLPLALLIAWTALHNPVLPMIFATLVPFAAFALAAALSKGRGMGWGDAKLAALGGAILGMAPSLFIFALAALAAVVLALMRGKKVTEPIAFGPYLAAGILLGMLVQSYR